MKVTLENVDRYYISPKRVFNNRFMFNKFLRNRRYILEPKCWINEFQSCFNLQVLVNDKYGIYNASVEQDILIMDPMHNESFTGTLYNKTVVYPDYSMEKTTEWLKSSWLFSGFSDSFVLKDSWPENHKNLTNCTVTLPYIRDVRKFNIFLWKSRKFYAIFYVIVFFFSA